MQRLTGFTVIHGFLMVFLETSGKLSALPEENSRLEYGSVIRWIFSAKWTGFSGDFKYHQLLTVGQLGNNWFSINRSTGQIWEQNLLKWWGCSKISDKDCNTPVCSSVFLMMLSKKNRVPLFYGIGARKMSRNFCEDPEVGSVTLSQTHPWDWNLWSPV